VRAALRSLCGLQSPAHVLTGPMVSGPTVDGGRTLVGR
jgi:hypothetical protein